MHEEAQSHAIPICLIRILRISFILFQKAVRAIEGLVVSPSRRRLSSCLTVSESAWLLSYECFFRAVAEDDKAGRRSPLRVKSHILVRMIQTQRAVEILINHGYYAEAAVLALTQLEMALDIEYISDDATRSTQWRDHEELQKQPWSVKSKIDALRSNDKFMFSFLSAIKHGNPLLNSFSLRPIHEAKHNLELSAFVCALSASYLIRGISAFGGHSSPISLREFVRESNLRDLRRSALILARDAWKSTVPADVAWHEENRTTDKRSEE